MVGTALTLSNDQSALSYKGVICAVFTSKKSGMQDKRTKRYKKNSMRRLKSTHLLSLDTKDGEE